MICNNKGTGKAPVRTMKANWGTEE